MYPTMPRTSEFKFKYLMSTYIFLCSIPSISDGPVVAVVQINTIIFLDNTSHGSSHLFIQLQMIKKNWIIASYYKN